MKTQLKKIACFSKGQQINGEQLLSNGKYDYLNGGIYPSGKWSDYNVEGDTIAISEGGNSCGYVNYMESNFWCGGHCYYLYDVKCSSKYLYYALKSQQDRIMKLRSGACMPNIKKKDLADFVFEYNDNSIVQKKVVLVLDTLESVILYKQLFVKKLDELIKSRFVEMFDSLNNYTAFSDLCTIITDGTHQPPKFVEEGIPFLFVSNIVTNSINYEAEKFISEDTYNELYKRTPIEIGDIIMSTVGSYGHPAVVTSNKKFLFQRHIAYLKPKKDIINSLFLHSAILSEKVQEQIERRVKGIAQKTLNLSEIKQLRIPLPDLHIQNQFADFVTQVEKQKAIVQKSIDHLETLKKSLMQEYFG